MFEAGGQRSKNIEIRRRRNWAKAMPDVARER
jgi:hypothetical protein